MATDLVSTSADRVADDCPIVDVSIEQVSSHANPLARRLKMGAAWVVVARLLGIGVTMLVNVALARWLSPEAFGDFLLLSSILSLASLLAMMGLNAALVRFVSESMAQGDMARARHCVRLIFALASVAIVGVGAIVALAFGYWEAPIFGLPNVPGIVPMVVASLALLAVLQLVAETCRGLHELRLASMFSGGQTGGLLSNMLLLVLLGGAMLWATPSFSLAVGLNLIAMSICVPIAVGALLRALRERLAGFKPTQPDSTVSARKLMSFALPVLMIQLLTFATTQTDLWIAGICCPHDQLALYGAARRLVLLVTIPLQMANLTVVSTIAELHVLGRRAELERVLRGATSLAAWPSIAAIVALTLCGGPILELLFGSYFRQAALPLAILGVGQLLLVCVGSCGCALEMTGHQLGSLCVNLVSAVAMVALGTWAARQFGILGLAMASTGVIGCQSVALWLLARRFVGIWTHPFLRPWSRLD